MQLYSVHHRRKQIAKIVTLTLFCDWSPLIDEPSPCMHNVFDPLHLKTANTETKKLYQQTETKSKLINYQQANHN